MYKGNERQRTVEVSVDGEDVTTWTSSGTTLDFESIDLSGNSGQELTITGVLTTSEWISITEVDSLYRQIPPVMVEDLKENERRVECQRTPKMHFGIAPPSAVD